MTLPTIPQRFLKTTAHYHLPRLLTFLNTVETVRQRLGRLGQLVHKTALRLDLGLVILGFLVRRPKDLPELLGLAV